MSSSTNEAVIRDFCAAIERRDIDELLGFFTEDAVYHNIPFPPAEGHAAIRATFETYVPGSPAIQFEMVNLAVAGDVVFTERIDRMTFAGKDVELPVAGVFELRDSKITAWRDYFDPKMFFGG